MCVELRFRAAEATKPPAPRVVVGIIHGIAGFVGDDGVEEGKLEDTEGVEREVVNLETRV
jgi:hypothetical protein